MRLIKVILTDIAGVGLIILSALTGWIPGPGGIPLFLAGLGLLAINHKWAHRLLDEVKKHGLKIAEKFFREHPAIMAVYDVFSLALVAAGIFISIKVQSNLRFSAISVIIIGIGLFLGNRRRLRRITSYFKGQNK